MLTIVRLNARVQKYNLTPANYGLKCSKYYVIRYNMYAPTLSEQLGCTNHSYLELCL